MEDLKLHGTWTSPFSHRVIWALKLKGIPYEYKEEDLSNKSPLLLKYNPIHKMIPVLVHGGKPICESMVIVEYIDETWSQQYPLLPADPYGRALARFWIKFSEDKCLSIWKMFRATGEDLENTKKDCLEMLRIIEEYALEGEKKFFFGERMGMVDIAFGEIAHWLGVVEEIVGVKLLEANSFPRLHSWIQNFKEVPEIKDNLSDRDEAYRFFKSWRERLLTKS